MFVYDSEKEKLSRQKQTVKIETRKDGIHLFLNDNEIGLIIEYSYSKQSLTNDITLNIILKPDELLDVISSY